MKYKVTEFTWDPAGSWRNGNPFTLAFCYPAEGSPYVLKGGSRTISNVMSKVTIPTVVHMTYWHKGKSRYMPMTFGFPSNVSIYFWRNAHKGSKRNGPRRYAEIVVRTNKSLSEKKFKMRRFPRCFPEQLREYVK
jgi:hypothetical protein